VAKLAYPALDYLRTADADDAVRRQAEAALKKMSPASRDDLGDLIAALKDGHPAVRAAAAQALALIGPEAEEAAASLDKLLADADAAVRVSAAEAVWEILKQPVPGLVPKLVGGLSDASAPVRVRAAGALGSMRTGDARALEALIAALAMPAARSASRPRGPSPVSVPSRRTRARLTQALEDTDAKVRLVAPRPCGTSQTRGRRAGVGASSCGKTTSKSASAPPRRWSAWQGCSRRGVRPRRGAQGCRRRRAHPRREGALPSRPDARVVIEGLHEALQAPDPALRSMAAFAMGNLGTEGRAAVPKLRRALEDVDVGVRLSAAQALWSLERRPDDLLPTLTQALKERDAAVRARAAATLGGFGGKASPAVADLFALLSEPDAGVRIAAVKALGDIGGPLARATYPTLAELAKEAQPEQAIRPPPLGRSSASAGPRAWTYTP